MVIDGDDRCCPAFAGDGAAESSTTIEDLPADVLALVLRRLDGASLAALGCTCAAFRDLAADPAAWRALCLALWPSLRNVPLRRDANTDAKAQAHHHQRLFADAFPFPAVPLAALAPSPLPARLVSAVDLRQGGVCVMSRAVETDASSAWFLGAPFRIDALAQEGFTLPAPAPIVPAELELSWVLIDPDSGRAVNASSRRPVSVDRRWLTGETVVRFALVLGAGGVVLDAAVTCDERYGHVREVSLCMEDAEGGGVSGRDGLAVVAAAMAGARRGRGAEEENKVRYQEFVKGRADRKERKARREGIIDLCCSGVGAAALLGFLLMLTFR
jgi:hypothetical protein